MLGARPLKDAREVVQLLYSFADVLTVKKSNSSEEVIIFILKGARAF